jgi:hypothetical protein
VVVPIKKRFLIELEAPIQFSIPIDIPLMETPFGPYLQELRKELGGE